MKKSSREKLYWELGLEYLYQRRWARRLCLLYKAFSTGQPSYIYDLLPPMRSSRRHVNSFNTVSCKSEYFKTILKFIRLDSVEVKLLTRLRLGFSHLREHKFRHGFRDLLNPLCPCSIETEITAQYFLRCYFYNANRSALMNKLNEIDRSSSTLNENTLIDLILYGIYGKYR